MVSYTVHVLSLLSGRLSVYCPSVSRHFAHAILKRYNSYHVVSMINVGCVGHVRALLWALLGHKAFCGKVRNTRREETRTGN